MHRRSLSTAGLLLGLTTLAVAPDALAQPNERSGLLLGASIGIGNSSPDQCQDCETGLAVEGRIGTVLTPRLALLASASSVAAAPNVLSDRRGRHQAFIAALQKSTVNTLILTAGATFYSR